MSAFDIFIRNNVANPFLPVAFVLIALYFSKDCIIRLRKRAFALCINHFSKKYSKATDEIKTNLFKPLKEVVSRDWRLKNAGLIRVLELGIGTGTNMKYYPKGTQLVALDWNDQMESLCVENCKKFPHVTLEKFIVASAEDLSQIEDNSVDAVVCTLLLCSAGDVNKILEEVKRVLAPGGHFCFLEHVHADPGTTLRRIQSFLTVTKIWPILFLGCELNRNTGDVIEKAGFSKVSIKRINIDFGGSPVLAFVKYHVSGCATK